MGVGGGGGNAVNRMAKSDLHGVESLLLTLIVRHWNMLLSPIRYSLAKR